MSSRAHVDDARQPEQRAGRRGRDAVLAGAGLGDDAGLAEPAREQRLAERVVDLVRAGVGEVLALQVQPEARGHRAAGRGGRARARGPRREAVRAIERRRPAGEGREQLAELRPEARVVAERVVRRLELDERGHQRLGDVPAAELAIRSPSGRGRPPRAGRDRRASGAPARFGRSVRGGPGALDEQRDPQRVLARPLAGDPRRLDARRDVDADGGSAPQRVADVRRIEAAGQRRPAPRARPRRRGRGRRAAPVPPGCGPPEVSRRIRAAPASQERAGPLRAPRRA